MLDAGIGGAEKIPQFRTNPPSPDTVPKKNWFWR